MHVGLSLIFQGSATRTDHEVYADELKLAHLAEPLGFDSVWTVEHHFTSYTMVPDALQFLTYMAGCTERVQLGTMVVVLPWHDPVRVAEGVALLSQQATREAYVLAHNDLFMLTTALCALALLALVIHKLFDALRRRHIVPAQVSA